MEAIGRFHPPLEGPAGRARGQARPVGSKWYGRNPMTSDKLEIRILGCGSSGGVPRLGGADGSGFWGACDPANPKNRRRRCSLLVRRVGAGGVTQILVDNGKPVEFGQPLFKIRPI